MKISSEESKGHNLPLGSGLDAQQLDNIKAHLDLILVALESLAKIGSDSILQAAQALDLDKVIAHRVGLWRLRQASPLRKSSSGRKKLDIEEARSLVLIICYLAKEYQDLIRRAVTLLEQVNAQDQEPSKIALLGDYLDTFSSLYENRMEATKLLNHAQLSQLAFKLLVDLLFYSSHHGHRRLWLALLDYSNPSL